MKHIALAAVIAVAVILCVWASGAYAHSWYTGYQNSRKQSCCGGSDCAQLPDDAVHPIKGGYTITYLPPGFPNASQLKMPITIPNAEAQPGEDPVHYHLCIWGSEAKCFFTPAPGF